MKNGSEFIFAIPAPGKIEADRFTSDVEFPFSFDEIVCIEVPNMIGQGKHGLTNDLSKIHAVFPIYGLILVSGVDSVKIVAEHLET